MATSMRWPICCGNQPRFVTAMQHIFVVLSSSFARTNDGSLFWMCSGFVAVAWSIVVHHSFVAKQGFEPNLPIISVVCPRGPISCRIKGTKRFSYFLIYFHLFLKNFGDCRATPLFQFTCLYQVVNFQLNIPQI